MNIEKKKNRQCFYNETYFKGNTTIHIVEPKMKNTRDVDKILEEYCFVVFRFFNSDNIYRKK